MKPQHRRDFTDAPAPETEPEPAAAAAPAANLNLTEESIMAGLAFMKNQQFSQPLSQPRARTPEPKPDSPEPVRPVGCDSEDSEDERLMMMSASAQQVSGVKWRPKSSSASSQRANRVSVEIAPPASMDYYAHASSGKGRSKPVAVKTDLSQSFRMGLDNRTNK